MLHLQQFYISVFTISTRLSSLCIKATYLYEGHSHIHNYGCLIFFLTSLLLVHLLIIDTDSILNLPSFVLSSFLYSSCLFLSNNSYLFSFNFLEQS